MMAKEFKTQIFKTSDQWKKGGLFYRLTMEKDKDITPYSMPAFSKWILKINGVKNPICLAVDECEQIYFIDKDREMYKIYRYDPNLDPKIQKLERISCIGDYDSDPGKFTDPKRIIFDKYTLWILDAGNHKIQAFSRENYQIKYIIGNLNNPIDIGLDEKGYLYILDKKEDHIFKIFTYTNNGQNIEKHFEESCLKDPIGLAIGKENALYVIDREVKGFLRFTEQGECSKLGDFSKIHKDSESIDFRPSAVTIDRKGNIFVTDETGQLYQFDPDGSYIGKIPIPYFKGQIHGIAIDYKGSLYVSSSEGIAFLSTEQKSTKEEGVYYSRTLDGGIQDCQWHRLELQANIPPKAIIKVYYYSSNEPALKERIDNILFSSNNSTQKKAEDIDSKIKWVGPEVYYSSDDPESKGVINEVLSDSKKLTCPETDFEDKKIGSEQELRNMLFREKRGRYLWLKLVLSTFDENVKPTVTQMKIFYPRISYLRYLPAIYQGDLINQEDLISKEFLERFLSIFETVFYDLETEISQIFRYFDPDSIPDNAPQNFLTWLASWLNVALEEDWPEDKKRYFIQRASTLYKLKGTLEGLEELIKIYTGKKPLILEYSKIGRLMVLSEKGEFRLGINSLLLQTPIRGFRLGDDSILGRVALRDIDITKSYADPFLPLAHWFTVILDLSTEEFARYSRGVERILNDEKPAHTMYNLRVQKEMSASMGMYVGINTRVAEYKPIHLGDAAAIGSGIVVMGREKGGRVEHSSRLDNNIELI